MQFRCYHCKFVIHDGIPPLEALSGDQASFVGPIDDNADRFEMLVGTPYEGMSIYQFCSFCVVAIRDFPTAIFTDCGHKCHFNNDRLHYEYMSVDCERCGQIWHKERPGESWGAFDYTLQMRASTLHRIEVTYANADLALVRGLYSTEA